MVQRVSRTPKPRPRFIEPMECRSVAKLPEGEQWVYEVKQDGYRAEAIIDGSTVTLYSIAGHGFNEKFPQIVESLKWLKLRSAVLDGELVALDEQGRPSFNEIQNWKTTKRPIVYYVFDVLHVHGRDLLDRSITERKQRLQDMAKSFSAPIILNQHFAVDLDSFTQQVRSIGLEGIVAKRANSLYHPGQKSDAWQKHHFKQQGKFIIGGYVPGPTGVGELLVGVDESTAADFAPDISAMLTKELKKHPRGSLLFVKAVNAGLNQFNRRELHEELKPLRTKKCPFINLPERRRHKHALTEDKMNLCVWLKPERRCELAYHEWTPSAHLRHPEFRELVS